jgi:succinyl-diaminopimelate desuccinylase
MLDNYLDEMVEALSEIVRVPAIGPESGGDGEFLRSRLLKDMVDNCGFDEVNVYECFDDRVKLKARPNIIAKKKGRTEQTVWIVSHMDTVPPGDLQAWSFPPFRPKLEDGKLYGLGTEDDCQAVVSSLFAAKMIIDMGVELERGIGLAIVADEEFGSDKGIKWLLEQDIFKKDDMIYVPDFGVPDGTFIEVAEKTIMWLKVNVIGKQTHASTPNRGLNAEKIGAEMVAFLADYMERKYAKTNPLFDPPISTFEPTKHLLNVANVNTIPGDNVFYLDFRILPDYNHEDVLKTMHWIADLFMDKTGAKITIEIAQLTVSGKPSSTESEAYVSLASAIKRIKNVTPKAGGVGGGTCANLFRLAGFDAYVWQTTDEKCHSPNEYCKLESLLDDTKVYTCVLADLCLPKEN